VRNQSHLVDRFVHDQNLCRYADLLERETDPAVRARLQDLLIEEEDLFGTRRERLQQARDHVERLRGRMVRQEQLILRLEDGGHDTGLARQLYDAWSDTLVVLERYRDNLQRDTDGSLGD
jgi:hypothetical protein